MDNIWLDVQNIVPKASNGMKQTFIRNNSHTVTPSTNNRERMHVSSHVTIMTEASYSPLPDLDERFHTRKHLRNQLLKYALTASPQTTPRL